MDSFEYEAPVVEELGSLAALTLGSKFNSTSDFQNGIPPATGGPGS